jgi:hypothetical protein
MLRPGPNGVPIASILTPAAEVASLVAAWIVIRGALAGFWVLRRGGTIIEARAAAADMAFASFPSAMLIGVALVLFLLFTET